MKKLFAVLFLFNAWLLSAQDHYFGPVAGVNLSNVSYSWNFIGINHEIYKAGITGGVEYEYIFKNGFNIGFDVLYDQRRHAYSDFSLVTYLYNYISCPLKIGYYTGKKFGVSVKGGAIPSYFINGYSKWEVYYYGDGLSSIDKDEIRKHDWAAFSEIGGRYNINNKLSLYSGLMFRHSFKKYYIINNVPRRPETYYRHYSYTWIFCLKYKMNR